MPIQGSTSPPRPSNSFTSPRWRAVRSASMHWSASAGSGELSLIPNDQDKKAAKAKVWQVTVSHTCSKRCFSQKPIHTHVHPAKTTISHIDPELQQTHDHHSQRLSPRFSFRFLKTRSASLSSKYFLIPWDSSLLVPSPTPTPVG